MRGEHATKNSDLYALGACLLYLAQGTAGGLEQITSLPENEYNKAMRQLLDKVKDPLDKIRTEGKRMTKDYETQTLIYNGFILTMLLAYRPDDRNNDKNDPYDIPMTFADLLFPRF